MAASPLTPELVASAIKTALSSTNQEVQARANMWLNELQGKNEAWPISLALMVSKDPHVEYFSTNMLLSLIRTRWRTLDGGQRSAVLGAMRSYLTELLSGARHVSNAQLNRFALAMASASAMDSPAAMQSFLTSALSVAAGALGGPGSPGPGTSTGASASATAGGPNANPLALHIALEMLSALGQEVLSRPHVHQSSALAMLRPQLPAILRLLEAVTVGRPHDDASLGAAPLPVPLLRAVKTTRHAKTALKCVSNLVAAGVSLHMLQAQRPVLLAALLAPLYTCISNVPGEGITVNDEHDAAMELLVGLLEEASMKLQQCDISASRANTGGSGSGGAGGGGAAAAAALPAPLDAAALASSMTAFRSVVHALALAQGAIASAERVPGFARDGEYRAWLCHVAGVLARLLAAVPAAITAGTGEPEMAVMELALRASSCKDVNVIDALGDCWRSIASVSIGRRAEPWRQPLFARLLPALLNAAAYPDDFTTWAASEHCAEWEGCEVDDSQWRALRDDVLARNVECVFSQLGSAFLAHLAGRLPADWSGNGASASGSGSGSGAAASGVGGGGNAAPLLVVDKWQRFEVLLFALRAVHAGVKSRLRVLSKLTATASSSGSSSGGGAGGGRGGSPGFTLMSGREAVGGSGSGSSSSERASAAAEAGAIATLLSRLFAAMASLAPISVAHTAVAESCARTITCYATWLTTAPVAPVAEATLAAAPCSPGAAAAPPMPHLAQGCMRYLLYVLSRMKRRGGATDGAVCAALHALMSRCAASIASSRVVLTTLLDCYATASPTLSLEHHQLLLSGITRVICRLPPPDAAAALRSIAEPSVSCLSLMLPLLEIECADSSSGGGKGSGKRELSEAEEACQKELALLGTIAQFADADGLSSSAVSAAAAAAAASPVSLPAPPSGPPTHGAMMLLSAVWPLLSSHSGAISASDAVAAAVCDLVTKTVHSAKGAARPSLPSLMDMLVALFVGTGSVPAVEAFTACGEVFGDTLVSEAAAAATSVRTGISGAGAGGGGAAAVATSPGSIAAPPPAAPLDDLTPLFARSLAAMVAAQLKAMEGSRLLAPSGGPGVPAPPGAPSPGLPSQQVLLSYGAILNMTAVFAVFRPTSLLATPVLPQLVAACAGEVESLTAAAAAAAAAAADGAGASPGAAPTSALGPRDSASLRAGLLFIPRLYNLLSGLTHPEDSSSVRSSLSRLPPAIQATVTSNVETLLSAAAPRLVHGLLTLLLRVLSSGPTCEQACDALLSVLRALPSPPPPPPAAPASPAAGPPYATWQATTFLRSALHAAAGDKIPAAPQEFVWHALAAFALSRTVPESPSSSAAAAAAAAQGPGSPQQPGAAPRLLQPHERSASFRRCIALIAAVVQGRAGADSLRAVYDK